MTSSESIYLAGFIDGEGSLIINKRLHSLKEKVWIGYSVYLDIGNTNKEVLEWIKKITQTTSELYENPQKGNRKMAYRLRICGKQAQRIIKELYPYLIVKKKQANIFLDFPLNHKRLKREIRENLFQQMRKLNYRGILNV